MRAGALMQGTGTEQLEKRQVTEMEKARYSRGRRLLSQSPDTYSLICRNI